MSCWVETAAEIGSQVVAAGESRGGHLYWPDEVERSSGLGAGGEAGFSVWGGVGGIALFLLELYGVTEEREQLESASRALSWCVARHDTTAQPRPVGLLSGVSGLVYVHCRAFDVSGEERYLREGLRLARGLLPAVRAGGSSDFLSGLSGAVLALAHLEARTGDDDVALGRNDGLAELLRGTRANGDGVFWDASPDWKRPLCGFAHGPSGVAFVLLELAARTGAGPDHPLLDVAAAAFAYEDQFFDPEESNWPDHRYPGRGDRPHRYVNAWCHGAAGIGLARLRAPDLGLSNQTRYLDAAAARTARDIDRALNAQQSWLSLTLCHGFAGLADYLLSGSWPEYEGQVQAVAQAVVDQLRTVGGILPGYAAPDTETHSLFVGSAGVGAFLLRVAHPDTVPSILRPCLPDHHLLGLVDPERVTDCLETAFFPRSRRLTMLLDDGELAGPARTLRGADLPDAIGKGLARLSESVDAAARERALDLLELERAHVRASREVTDYVRLCTGWGHGSEGDAGGSAAGDAAGSDGGGEKPLVLRREARVLRVQWDWRRLDADSWRELRETPAGDHAVVVLPRVDGTSEQWIGGLSATVLRRLSRPATPGDVVAELENPGDRDAARRLIDVGSRTGLLQPVEPG